MTIPYFIEIGGCINCEASKSLKQKTGKDYGFDHELMAKCVLTRCGDHGYTLVTPFIDPREVIKFAEKNKNQKAIEQTEQYCLKIIKKFGKYYDTLEISLDKLINDLKAIEVK